MLLTLKAVINGEAEVIFSFFDSRLKGEQKATTKEEAKTLMKEIKDDNFQGGSTKISSCIIKAIEKIQNHLESKKVTKPELVVVTDGDDNTTSLRKEDLKQVKLHSFIIGGSNPHLLKLAKSTGGVGIQLE